MYLFKKELKQQLLKGTTIRYLAKEIGISEVHLTNILNGKNTCKKTTAYCIVKFNHNDKEIEDFFNILK